MEEKIKKLTHAVDLINKALLLSKGSTECGADFAVYDDVGCGCKACKEYYRCKSSYEIREIGEEVDELLKSIKQI